MASTEVGTISLDDISTIPSTLKKRRRRVPTTGASEDCFACIKRGSGCDRRRPYCSQCLEVGKDCSGYRTTLTWGVGVASRGKLRGLALPVPQSALHASASAPASAREPACPLSSTFPLKGPRTEENNQVPRKRTRLAPISTSHGKRSNGGSLSATYAIPQQYSHTVNGMSWQTVPDAHRQGRTNPRKIMPRYAYASDHNELFPLHTSIGTSFRNVPWTASTFPAQSDRSRFPGNYSLNNDNMSNDTSLGSSSTSDWSYFELHDELPFGWHPVNDTEFEGAGRMRQRLSPSAPDQLNDMNSNDQHIDENASVVRSDTGATPQTLMNQDASRDVNNVDGKVALPASHAATAVHHPIYDLNLFSIPPRMSYLLDYYNKAICPVLVAFDGPTNPYRRHILDLATQNPGLQNAIGALTTNNIRMRSLEEISPNIRRSSPAQAAASKGAPTPEEQHYKGMAIEYLNAQLADPSKAQEDSVLATLLILCLFHVCDSGFSKFKTQLAGVQKLLKMRGSHQRTDFVGWIEMFFAWFDVMTSAVNDRETHLQGGTLDLADVSSDLGEVEQFSGCDGKLFKLIARLGRLNLLSQSRPVAKLSEPSSAFPEPPPARPRTRQSSKDFYSLPEGCLDPEQWSNGFEDSSTVHDNAFMQPMDGRTTFWEEWRTLRERLQAWQVDGSSDPQTLSLGQRDMQYISESFRWSALLYTERLAHPTAPSSSANLQLLVRRGLHHIAQISVNSCVTKFMLWPLFITGTECVDDVHRSLIRQRCVEIQKESGFYNNASGLEVLERVWQENDQNRCSGREEVSNMTQCGVQAFRWRNCMDRVDGEYIVI